MRLTAYVTALAYLLFIGALIAVVTFADAKRYQFGIATTLTSLFFTLLAHLSQRITVTKWLPFAGIFLALVYTPYDPWMIKSGRMVQLFASAFCLNLVLALGVLRLRVYFSGVSPLNQQSLPKPSSMRTHFLLFCVIIILCGVAILSTERIEDSFPLLALGILSWLFMLYHFAFDRILYDAARKSGESDQSV